MHTRTGNGFSFGKRAVPNPNMLDSSAVVQVRHGKTRALELGKKKKPSRLRKTIATERILKRYLLKPEEHPIPLQAHPSLLDLFDKVQNIDAIPTGDDHIGAHLPRDNSGDSFHVAAEVIPGIGDEAIVGTRLAPEGIPQQLNTETTKAPLDDINDEFGVKAHTLSHTSSTNPQEAETHELPRPDITLSHPSTWGEVQGTISYLSSIGTFELSGVSSGTQQHSNGKGAHTNAKSVISKPGKKMTLGNTYSVRTYVTQALSAELDHLVANMLTKLYAFQERTRQKVSNSRSFRDVLTASQLF
jgi:hypothetical protein